MDTRGALSPPIFRRAGRPAPTGKFACPSHRNDSNLAHLIPGPDLQSSNRCVVVKLGDPQYSSCSLLRKGLAMSAKDTKDSKKAVKMTVPLLPLRDVIIFPHMVVPLFVGREKSINALEECSNEKLDLFLVAQRQATTVSPGEKDIFEVGTLGTILQILRLPDNTVKVLIEGKKRARIVEYAENDRMIEAGVEA